MARVEHEHAIVRHGPFRVCPTCETIWLEEKWTVERFTFNEL